MTAIQLEAYSDWNTLISDPSGELNKARQVRFSTGIPGIYQDLSFHITRDVLQFLAAEKAKIIRVRSGQKIAYEGHLRNLQSLVDIATQGITLRCVGGAGAILGTWPVLKRWSDNRIDEQTWPYLTTASGAEKCTIDRNARLRFTPKGVAWNNTEGAAVTFTMPTGDTVKRITFDYDLQEGGQNWQIELYNVGTSSVVWSTSTSGTGSRDETLATPSQSVRLQFRANAGQTPTEDGTYYGEFSNIVVYSETGSINMEEIAKDLVGIVTNLNSDVTQIAAAGTPLTVTPFLVDRWEMAANILDDLTARGDGAYNAWVWSLISSEKATTPNGKPVLKVQQYPSTSDYDLIVRVGEKNLVLPLQISEDRDVANWIAVEYYDENGNYQQISPNDDSNLTNSDSVSLNYRQGAILRMGYATSTVATAYARRYLAQNYLKRWRPVSPLIVRGYIRTKNGDRLRAPLINALMRVRIENEQDVSGGALTWVIGSTTYDAESDTCSISVADPLAPIVPVLAAPIQSLSELSTSSAGAGSGGGMQRHIWQLLGISRAEFERRGGKSWWQSSAEKRAAIRRKKQTGRYKP